MKNENGPDLKRIGKQLSLSELKISQSVKLIVKDDAIVTERNINAENISCRILEKAFSSLWSTHVS